MGESENKFLPNPQGIWFKIRKKDSRPKLLQIVMQELAELEETAGATHCRIVEYLDGVLNCSRDQTLSKTFKFTS